MFVVSPDTPTYSFLEWSKKAITDFVNFGESFDAKFTRSTVLDKLGRKFFGWEKSFIFCTDRQQFKSLDEKVSKIVSDYEMAISRIISKAPINIRMKALGIPSTEELFIKDLEKKSQNKK